MADSKDLDKSFETVLEFMDLLSDGRVDALELRASQIMWDRYQNHHPDDFQD